MRALYGATASKSDIDEIPNYRKVEQPEYLESYTFYRYIKLQTENTTPSAKLFRKLNWITFRQNACFRQAQTCLQVT